jgi:predicted transcriptional regulator of viral defense system
MQIEHKMRNYPTSCFTNTEFEAIFKLTNDQKYGRIKRSIQKGDLLHIRRGLYCLNDRLTHKKIHPFELAQKICWPSYISLESALAHHELIPEAVYNITSVTTKRSKSFNTPLGNFSFHKLPDKNFFIDVERVKEIDSYFFIAKPWKAILDYIYCYKKNWRSLEPLAQDLRIEINELPSLTNEMVGIFNNFYGNIRIKTFLKNISRELQL